MDSSPPAKRQRRAPNAWQVARRRKQRVLRQLLEAWKGNWVKRLEWRERIEDHVEAQFRRAHFERHNAWPRWGDSDMDNAYMTRDEYGAYEEESGCSMCSDYTCQYCCDDCHGC